MTSAPAKVTGLANLTMQLTSARMKARQGESLLYLGGIVAYTVASALALTVAGGTWMFWNRNVSPHGLLLEVMKLDPSYKTVTQFYVGLAALACAMLIPTLVNLAASAAVLGARGRERRLAVLRLVGLSSGDVVRMSLLDSLLQAVIGMAVGSVVYFATLPLWSNLTMLSMPLEFGEMLLPWWLFLAVVAVILLIALFATWRGLRQVLISPLGVSRRSSKPALTWVRFVIFLVLLGVGIVGISLVQPGADFIPWLVFGGLILAVIAGFNIVAPWFLQQGARMHAKLPWPSLKWAARRIEAEPGATWRRVSAMGLLSFIGGFMSIMPISPAASDDAASVVKDFVASTQWDLTKGVIITIAVGFVLTATSMLVTQASATIERAEQSRALQRMGAPASFSLKTMWLETFGPLAVSIVGGGALGMLMASPMLQLMEKFGMDPTMGIKVMVGVLVTGLVLAAASLLASHPLYFNLLGKQERRND